MTRNANATDTVAVPRWHGEDGDTRPSLVTDAMSDARSDAPVVVRYADAIMAARPRVRTLLWARLQREHPGHVVAVAERACGIPRTVAPESVRPVRSMGSQFVVSWDTLAGDGWDVEDTRPGITPSPSILDVLADALNRVRDGLDPADAEIVRAWLDARPGASWSAIARAMRDSGVATVAVSASGYVSRDTIHTLRSACARFVSRVAAAMVEIAREGDRAPIGRVRDVTRRERPEMTAAQKRYTEYARDYGRAGARDLMGTSRDLIGGYPWAGPASGTTVARIADDVRAALESPANRARAAAEYRAAMAAGMGRPVPSLADAWRERGLITDANADAAATARVIDAPVTVANARAVADAMFR